MLYISFEKMFRILEEVLYSVLLEEVRVTMYLPVGVCSKNDKGECINEFNIFVKPQVSVPLQ